MERKLTINGKEYTAIVTVVRESDEIKARAARERIAEFGALLSERLEGRDKNAKRDVL